MTIYSQHANRGKTQILATYNADEGTISSTVTSVDDATVAAPIVDALNRISASASVPVSIRDERSENYVRYPSQHLAALTDPNCRAELLAGHGEYGLWYEYAMLMLHQALADLDTSIAPMPAPVRTAVAAELEAEARGLRVGLHEYEEGPSEEETDRLWDFEDPFVRFEGGMVELSRGMRERLYVIERYISAEELAQICEDLRLLHRVFTAEMSGIMFLEEEHLTISFEHGDRPDGCFLTIQAPLPRSHRGPSSWSIDISRWVPDEYDSEGEVTGATGESVVDCVLAVRPTADDLVNLLRLAKKDPEQLSTWAKTPVGEPLAGTAFITTKQY